MDNSILNPAPNILRGHKVDQMSTKDLDLRQRTVINSAAAVNGTDCPNLAQVQGLITPVSQSVTDLQGYVNGQIANTVKKIPPPVNLNATPLTLGATGGQIAFFTNNTSLAVVKQVLVAYTSHAMGGAFIGINNGASGSPYAQVADLNTLRIAYEALRMMCEDLRSKLQTSTLVG